MEPIKITITHVIDPNRFYFRTSEEELKQIEKKMLGFLKTQPQLADQLKIGDVRRIVTAKIIKYVFFFFIVYSALLSHHAIMAK